MLEFALLVAEYLSNLMHAFLFSNTLNCIVEVCRHRYLVTVSLIAHQCMIIVEWEKIATYIQAVYCI